MVKNRSTNKNKKIMFKQKQKQKTKPIDTNKFDLKISFKRMNQIAIVSICMIVILIL